MKKTFANWLESADAVKVCDIDTGDITGTLYRSTRTKRYIAVLREIGRKAPVVLCAYKREQIERAWAGDLFEHEGAYTRATNVESLREVVYMPGTDNAW